MNSAGISYGELRQPRHRPPMPSTTTADGRKPAHHPRRRTRHRHPERQVARLHRRRGLPVSAQAQPAGQFPAAAFRVRAVVVERLRQTPGQECGGFHRRVRGGHRAVRADSSGSMACCAATSTMPPCGNFRRHHLLQRRRFRGKLHGASWSILMAGWNCSRVCNSRPRRRRYAWMSRH